MSFEQDVGKMVQLALFACVKRINLFVRDHVSWQCLQNISPKLFYLHIAVNIKWENQLEVESAIARRLVLYDLCSLPCKRRLFH